MHIQELNIHRNFFDTTNNKRIFFAIYYDEPDGERSFERAAETWRKKMLFQNNFKYGFDEFLMFRISHEIQ